MTSPHPGGVERAIQLVHISMQAVDIETRYLELIRRHRINPEVGLGFHSLETMGERRLKRLAREIRSIGVSATVHCPFNEIFPGAPDPVIRSAAIDRLDYAFSIARHFTPRAIVMHLNYEERRFRYLYERWLGAVLPVVARFAEKAAGAGAILCLENVYEETPDGMRDVLERLSACNVYMCLDVGHVRAFSSTPLPGWIEAAGPFVRQLHLHDNDAAGDRHLPIGAGSIDFGVVRSLIENMRHEPIITLEPHSEEDIWKTLEGFVATGLCDALEQRRKRPSDDGVEE